MSFLLNADGILTELKAKFNGLTLPISAANTVEARAALVAEANAAARMIMSQYQARTDTFVSAVAATGSETQVAVVPSGDVLFARKAEFATPVVQRTSLAAQVAYFPLDEFEIRQAESRQAWMRKPVEQALREVIEVTNAAAILRRHTVMNAMLANTPQVVNSSAGQTVSSQVLWTGADGATPPSTQGGSFAASHAHYWCSNSMPVGFDSATTWRVAHVRRAEADLKSHRLSVSPVVVAIANPTTAEQLRGQEGFIAAQSVTGLAHVVAAPTNSIIVGSLAAAEFDGFTCIGNVGEVRILTSDIVPVDKIVYLDVSASTKPVRVRVPEDVALQGVYSTGGWANETVLGEGFSMQIGAGIQDRSAAIVEHIGSETTYPGYEFGGIL